VGFIPAAALMGLIAEAKLDRSFSAALPCALAADALIFACGFAWLVLRRQGRRDGHGIAWPPPGGRASCLPARRCAEGRAGGCGIPGHLVPDRQARAG